MKMSIRNYYTNCVITNNHKAHATSIIPISVTYPNIYLNNCLYNNIVLSNNLVTKFNNFDFTFYPEPLSVSEFNNNGKIDYIGIFQIIALNDLNAINLKDVKLFACSKYFLRWHFYKFMEKYNIDFSRYNLTKDMISDNYLYIVKQVKYIEYCNLMDESFDVIMYPELNSVYNSQYMQYSFF